jgi:hypothetical protein
VGVSKAHKRLRLLACVCAGLLLTAPLYLGLAKSGIIRSPFFPRADGDLALPKSDRAGLRVLFVGNSFTYYNEMPAMVHDLAEGDPGARPLFAVEYTAPNWSLRKAAGDDGLGDLIEDVPWDTVVLQDRSAYLSYSREWWAGETLPYAGSLRREIATAGAQAMFFMTWGYEHGVDSEDSYEGMQARLADASPSWPERFQPISHPSGRRGPRRFATDPASTSGSVTAIIRTALDRTSPRASSIGSSLGATRQTAASWAGWRKTTPVFSS